MRSIENRPAAANLKKEVGHWEGDTVEGKAHKGGLGTFVDRRSMFVVLLKRKYDMEGAKNDFILERS